MDTKSVNMLLLIFPLSLMLCLIASMTNYIDAVIMVKEKEVSFLTILTITKFHCAGPVERTIIP